MIEAMMSIWSRTSFALFRGRAGDDFVFCDSSEGEAKGIISFSFTPRYIICLPSFSRKLNKFGDQFPLRQSRTGARSRTSHLTHDCMLINDNSTSVSLTLSRLLEPE